MTRRLATIAGLAAAAVAAVPATAWGHATLEASSPARGAVLPAAPAEVVFRFSEPVTGTAGAVRVFAPGGARVDRGGAFHPSGAPSQIGVRVSPTRVRGTYTATYQVISADGHVVGAGITFSVGSPSTPAASVSELLGRQRAGPATRTALAVARGVQFLAIAIAVGALLFLVLLWPRALRRAALGDEAPADAAFRARVRALVLGATAAGVLSAAAAIALEAAQVAGEPVLRALGDGALSSTLGSRFGTVWAIAAGVWLALALLSAWWLGPGRALGGVRAGVLLAGALALVLVPGLGGHAGALDDAAVLVPLNAVHVLAAAVWTGGIAVLLVALRPATATLTPERRTGLLVATIADFSALALAAVLLLALTGVMQALVVVGGPGDLVDTAYGRLALAKALLLAGLVVLGAAQRRRSLRGLAAAQRDGAPPGQAGLVMRRLLRAEAVLLLAVFAVTAALSGTAPPGAGATGPQNVSGTIGPARFEATVDPALTGPNGVHLYLLDPRTGAPWPRASEVDVSARNPRAGIGPLTQRARRAGAGHYLASGLQLGAPGTWTLTFTVRVGDFDEYQATRTVTVR